ncbi:MAG: translocation/assembly module TamB domain-containing protein, partial [Rhodospirillales bacterium]|nr:translocation/assembly module TamB domain-containing protein [Rhodospirillales bacterium]
AAGCAASPAAAAPLAVPPGAATVSSGAPAAAAGGVPPTPTPTVCAPARLAGTVLVRTATIRIPNRFPTSVQTIPVRWAGQTARAQHAAPAAPLPDVALALTIRAPQQIFVRGRGLNAELGGTVRIGGTLAQMQPSGGFKMIRGGFNLAGETLAFTSGTIRFQGASLADPSLDLVASAASGDSLTIGGTASKPSITLSSPSGLPPGEIMSELLFHTGSGSLSPVQLASVAAGLAEVSGGGSVPNPLESLRGALGLDQLGVGTGASGAPTLRAGRYVGRRLYVGAEQGTGQQSSQATVTYDLTKRLQLKATAGTGQTTSAIGAVGQAAGESVGIRYQVQY